MYDRLMDGQGKKKEARGGQVARLCSVRVEAVSQSHWAVWRLLKLPYELYTSRLS